MTDTHLSHSPALLAYMLAFGACLSLGPSHVLGAEPPAIRTAPGQTFNILDHGAKGEGNASNTGAFRNAIETCAAAGGGRVYVPAGTFITGPIELKSGVELHLDAAATIQFSRNLDDYPLVVAEYEGRSTIQARSPIWGERLRDVSIT